MESIIKKLELQIDEKPTGFVIRVNDESKCIIRICRIPKKLIWSGGCIDVIYEGFKNIK